MENRRLSKKVNILRQEKKKHLEEWNLLKYHLMGFNVVSKDKEEETNDLKTQQQQVRRGRWVRLRSGTIPSLSASLPIHPPVLSHTTFLISASVHQ